MQHPFEFVTLEQQSEEWKSFRSQYIGASDAPALMLVSPWKTELDLYNEKLYGDRSIVTDWMKRGLERESIILKKFNCLRSELFHPAVVKSLVYPFMIASLDGINLHDDCILEIKCPNKEDHEMAKDQRVPDKYYPQIQHQLAVTGFDYCYYVSENNDDMTYFRVFRNEDYIKSLVEVEQKFYERLKNWDPPPPSEKDYVYLEGNLIQSLCEDYISKKRELNLLKSEVDHLEEEMKNYSDERNWKCGDLKCTTITRKGSVDYSLIKELESVDLDKYRKKAVQYRQFFVSC